MFERISKKCQHHLDKSVIDDFLAEFGDFQSCNKPEEEPRVEAVSEELLRSAGFDISAGPAQLAFGASKSRRTSFQLHLLRLSYKLYRGGALKSLVWEHAGPFFRLMLTYLEPKLAAVPHKKSLLGIVTKRDVRRLTLLRTDEKGFRANAGLGVKEMVQRLQMKAKEFKQIFTDEQGVSGLHFILFPLELVDIHKWRFYQRIDVCGFEEGDNDNSLSGATRWAHGKGSLDGPADRSKTVTYDDSGKRVSHSQNASAVSHRSRARWNHVDVTSPHRMLPFIDIGFKPCLSDFANDQCKLASYLRKNRGDSSNLARDVVRLLRCALEKCSFESTVRALYDLSGCYREGTGVKVAVGVSTLLRCCARSMRLNCDTRRCWLNPLMIEIGDRSRDPSERMLLLMLLLSRRTLTSLSLKTAENTGGDGQKRADLEARSMYVVQTETVTGDTNVREGPTSDNKFHGHVLVDSFREFFPLLASEVPAVLDFEGTRGNRGNPVENIELAVKSYEDALQVYTRESYPSDWALAKMNLANTLQGRRKGNPVENIELAVESFKDTLQLYTHEGYPTDWALTKTNLPSERRGTRWKALSWQLRAMKMHYKSTRVNRTRVIEH